MNSSRKIVILSGNAHPELAKNIATWLNLSVGNCTVSKFANSETKVLINDSVRDVDLYIVQPTCNPSVNDHLMELLVMVDGAVRASAYRITAVVPFFGYARQSKKDKTRSPITCKLVANMMECAGINRVITIDLHSSQIQGFFNMPVENVYSEPYFLKYIKEHIEEKGKSDSVIIVAPGVGGVKRAKYISDKLGVKLAIVHRANKDLLLSQSFGNLLDRTDIETFIVGDVSAKIAVIIDDIADTCKTLKLASKALISKGALKVYAMVTHGIFSNNAIDIINESPITELVITDSIPNQSNQDKCPKLKVISMAPVLAETIRRAHYGESLISIENYNKNDLHDL
ncbi:phosphoribosyl pyrophosphate synthetase [Tieghemostelium lacteum]|uniref:ribose-phosphate diphosphokinase n=1 Tax=Tieghemostelium lacteum TaxID=361077 RepID=A0A151Z885_TIELA|nr:phosphoribosyl pyrophosphate synthetase [Tieghemostelium lacteum]|eukprot:KYQ90161.1 phosphoribosyl pyrophosphate synthetase [Tieghemostelium lacteum]